MILRMKAGAVVTWTSPDEMHRSVVRNSGVQPGPTVDTDSSFTMHFDTPGIYHFTITMLPRLIVTVVVE